VDIVGCDVGDELGVAVDGDAVGKKVVGCEVGNRDDPSAVRVGADETVGLVVVGTTVGLFVGYSEGLGVGKAEGTKDGLLVEGLTVGVAVLGLLVGDALVSIDVG
jgi:hypothetical protein